MAKYAGYIRVSRTEGREGERFIAPVEQRDKIEKWAALREHEIVEWFEDLDQSGGTTSRPEFAKALEKIESKDFDGIVVSKVDRFARSTVGALQVIERIENAGGHFASVENEFDTSTSAGRLMLRQMLSFAEFELDRIRETWQSAKERAVERGVYLHPAPFGYRKKVDGRLELDPAASKIVPQIFERRAKGDSWGAISKWLENKGVASPQGGEHWPVQTIRWIVSNRAYLGEASINGNTNAEAHKPLVDDDVWEAANAVKFTARKPSGNASGVLSGLLRCASCRYAMKVAMGKSRHGKPTREYRCKARGKEASAPCPQPTTIKATVVEPYVDEMTRKFFAGQGELVAEKMDVELQVAQAKLDEARAELENWNVVSKGKPLELLRGGLESRIEDVAIAEAEVESLSHKSQVANLEIPEDWDTKTNTEKAEIYHAIFDSIFVWPAPQGEAKSKAKVNERVYLYPLREGPTPLPVRGKRWTPIPVVHPSR